MHFRQLFDAESKALTYLLADGKAGEAVVIDPLKSQATLILALLAEHNLRLTYVLRTHVHRPDRSDCGELCLRTGAHFMLGENTPDDIPSQRLADGACINFGVEHITVLATPGHTPGSVCYLWQDRLFSGDTLCIRGCDCAGDDADPGQLFDSVKHKLFTLADETLVFPGHELNGRTVSTIQEERQYNPSFAGLNREAFVVAAREDVRTSPRKRKTALLSHGQGKW
ncbi:MBL fold metallo-hydrolase [Uliginosibacterium flavum]|uniref:MBL fold metallo-hydrolase n=1 Tax=Uliginosibacterium flavum TaxID=1396831 RepID=A0ABV2THG9_9RHOO